MVWKGEITLKFKKQFLCILIMCLILLPGCSANENKTKAQTEMQLSKIDMNRWQYNEENDVYWQVGIVYCKMPVDETYENLGIFVPGVYMMGKKNSDGTYTCKIDSSGTVGEFSAETAPIVIPVNTSGYTAMEAPIEYVNSTSTYTDAGFIYVYAGCRGRDAGAPAGVTDLKAAIRYVRYNNDIIPGSINRIFSFGMSGGGGQSALLGATGDSELYTPYLEKIGAVSNVSDAIAGSMCWCPITNLDYASEAYEWNLGITRNNLSEDMQELSDAMAEQFALYINQLELKDSKGNSLTLVTSEDGIYQAGSYYDYLKSIIETSLNNFLVDTTFPYIVASNRKGGFGGPGNFPDGEKDENFEDYKDNKRIGGKDGMTGKASDLDGKLPEIDNKRDGNVDENHYAIDRNETIGGINLTGTYETVQDYINALNAETTWVIYDSESNMATITSIADFVCALKIASKDLGAFDALDESQGENILFGDGDGVGDHFDAVMAKLLADSEYGTEFAEDLTRTDALGNSVTDRVNMYNPLYYISKYYKGNKSSNVASYWRIRTGINQSDTALTTEVNLALALENYGVDVDFETVWGQGHVEAERTGDSTSNFISWVIECCQ